jgi:Ni/Co efflux regulator RcnB
MNKLLSVIVAAMFAVGSASAFAASHAGAQMKDEKKTDKKAKTEKKASPKKEGEMKKGAPKKQGEAKKGAPKKDPKKEEMKK